MEVPGVLTPRLVERRAGTSGNCVTYGTTE
jgi:hypothetical protein